MVLRILNLEGHQKCIIGSKVKTILPKELLGQYLLKIFIRPGVAGAVLQTPLLLIN